MDKLGTETKPAIVKVQTEERAEEILDLCIKSGWQVIVGIEPDSEENIDDIKKLERRRTPFFNLRGVPARNAPCSCGSGKQYKRCCGS